MDQATLQHRELTVQRVASGTLERRAGGAETRLLPGLVRALVLLLPLAGCAPQIDGAARGLRPELAAKVSEIVSECGSRVISGVRHTLVAGTRRWSLHASGQAADLRGNPRCIYGALAHWPGGFSTDYGRVHHVHVSYAPAGPEWHMRFRHHRPARRHRHRPAR
jgi:hypothetical protein